MGAGTLPVDMKYGDIRVKNSDPVIWVSFSDLTFDEVEQLSRDSAALFLRDWATMQHIKEELDGHLLEGGSGSGQEPEGIRSLGQESEP